MNVPNLEIAKYMTYVNYTKNQTERNKAKFSKDELPSIYKDPKSKIVSRNSFKMDSLELLKNIKIKSDLLIENEKKLFVKVLDTLSLPSYYNENAPDKKERINTFRTMVYREELLKSTLSKPPEKKIKKRKEEEKDFPIFLSNKDSFIHKIKKRIMREDSLIINSLENLETDKTKKKIINGLVPRHIKIRNFKGNVGKKFLVMSREKFI